MLTMSSMEQFKSVKGESEMEEKAYKTMGKTGAFNLVLGICTLVAEIGRAHV